jgi:alpha/beta superfamily hydrolase
MSLQRKSVQIPVGEIHLEALVGLDDKTGAGPGVLVCHPHPQFGGSMDNNVVSALFDEFAQAGYIVVAFNFRGVGRSGGRHEDGQGEIRDVVGVLDWLEQRPETRGFGLGILGYSFGAWVGLRAAVQESRVRCVGAVAPPLAMYSFEFLDELLSPLFVVSGDQDPFCPSEMREPLSMSQANDRSWKVVEGADHFFWSHEREAARYLLEKFRKCLPP